MYGASYVELERAAGPEGSTRETVSRFTFCSVGPGASKEGDGGKRLLCPVLTPVFLCWWYRLLRHRENSGTFPFFNAYNIFIET